MLAVVEHEHEVSGGEGGERLRRRAGRGVSPAAATTAPGTASGSRTAPVPDEAGAVRRQRPRDLQRQTGLADAARPDQGHEPPAGERLLHRVEGAGGRQVDVRGRAAAARPTVARAWGWTVPGAPGRASRRRRARAPARPGASPGERGPGSSSVAAAQVYVARARRAGHVAAVRDGDGPGRLAVRVGRGQRVRDGDRVLARDVPPRGGSRASRWWASRRSVSRRRASGCTDGRSAARPKAGPCQCERLARRGGVGWPSRRATRAAPSRTCPRPSRPRARRAGSRRRRRGRRRRRARAAGTRGCAGCAGPTAADRRATTSVRVSSGTGCSAVRESRTASSARCCGPATGTRLTRRGAPRAG